MRGAHATITSPVQVHRSATPNGPLWIGVSGGKLCLFAGHPLAVACTPGRRASQHGLVLGIVKNPAPASDPNPNERFIIYGVVPDSRKFVWVKRGDAKIRIGPIRRNAFSVSSAKPVFEL